MSAWLRELKYAARLLFRNRTATAVAWLTLTLAIGATTAIFTIVDATLLRTLPFPEGERLVAVARAYSEGVSRSVSAPKFLFWRANGGSAFERLAAYESLGSGFNLTGSGRPERLTGSRVSADFFAAMGVHPVIGRDFRADEDVPNGPKLVVLAHDTWITRFAARADLVGRAVTLNDEPYTVIGIMPAGFRFPERTGLWTLFQFDPATQERANYFEVVGRLKPRVTRDQARGVMAGVMTSFRQSHPGMAGDRESIAVGALQDRLYGDLRTPLSVLLAAVALVLLIACVNVANLQLAGASERRHEIALRTALGASAAVIVRQLLLESLLLAVVSGLSGAALAALAVPALLAASPLAVAQADAIHVDLRVLGFATATSLASGLMAGLLPAWQATRTSLDQVLRAGAKRTTGGSAGWMRGTLVAGEVALALMLTIGSFLLVKSLIGLQQRHPGFVADHLLTMKMSLPEARYARGEAVALMAERMEERLRALPGVKSAAIAVSLPLQPGPDLPFIIQGRYKPGTTEGVAEALYRPVGTDYFQALQIPLRRGRLFDGRDRRGALPVALLNETAARKFFPGVDPIGQHIVLGQPYVPELADATPRVIVGIVADVRDLGVAADPVEALYIPLAQQNDAMTRLAIRLIPAAVVVRAESEPGALTQAVKEAIWSVDPQQPISDVRTMREIVTRSLGGPRFNTVLLGSLAGLALLLAAVGLYGVIAHIVGQQTREIGVRMALGATRSRVVGLFVRQAVWLSGLGVAAGLAGAVVVTRFLRTMLTDISTTDPWVFTFAPVILVVVAIAAALWPAARAARVDPASALRAD
jgi:putative ABC transport system permease protein